MATYARYDGTKEECTLGSTPQFSPGCLDIGKKRNGNLGMYVPPLKTPRAQAPHTLFRGGERRPWFSEGNHPGICSESEYQCSQSRRMRRGERLLITQLLGHSHDAVYGAFQQNIGEGSVEMVAQSRWGGSEVQ